MNEFSTLSAEDLINKAYSLREEFNTLHGSEDYSDETLDSMAEIVDALEQLQSEADRRVQLAAKREELAAKVEEFYNTCHDPETGIFCEGEDGPGRKRDNMKKAEAAIGKKAPEWMKNIASRRLAKGEKKAKELLPKDAPQYMKDILSRKVAESVKKGKSY